MTQRAFHRLRGLKCAAVPPDGAHCFGSQIRGLKKSGSRHFNWNGNWMVSGAHFFGSSGKCVPES